MKAKLVAFWNSLPHAVQAGVLFFGATAGGAIAKELSTPNACMTFSCIGSDLKAALQLGVAAVAGLYIKSSFYK